MSVLAASRAAAARRAERRLIRAIDRAHELDAADAVVDGICGAVSPSLVTKIARLIDAAVAAQTGVEPHEYGENGAA